MSYTDVKVVDKDTAFIGWPVEWLDAPGIPKPKKSNLHVTAAFIPNASDYNKFEIINALRGIEDRAREYRIAYYTGSAGFGVDQNIPVIMVDVHPNEHEGLYSDRTNITDHLTSRRILWDDTFRFVPHVTVDLATALKPPKKVLLRPLELWYRDDEPVKV